MTSLKFPRWLKKTLYYRPRIEAVLSDLDKYRLKLPLLSLDRLFPDFSERPVSFYEMPVGPWSTPLIDVGMLIKLALCARSRSVLEVGSYRGYTALALARHVASDARIVTIDADPRHGDAYRYGPFSAQIERRVGRIEPETIARDKPGSFDLIFLDADHSYTAVKNDTNILLGLLSERGYFVWHDYANWGKFSGKNGVPEYLHELCNEMPVARIAGTSLALHSPAWRIATGSDEYRRALAPRDNVAGSDPWTIEAVRG